MLIAILTLTILGSSLGLALGYASGRFHVEGDPIADQIDSLLPQTQCAQCGFPGCRPYAEAIAAQEAPINLCVPGGQTTMLAVSDLLGIDPVPMVITEPKTPAVAVIDELACIGCTLCIQACPVDAIVGAAKQMHVVISSLCTGCELCLPPCPVECIHLQPVAENLTRWQWPMPPRHESRTLAAGMFS